MAYSTTCQPEVLEDLTVVSKKDCSSSTSFRSRDLRVMGPARYTSCAMLLIYRITNEIYDIGTSSLCHGATVAAPHFALNIHIISSSGTMPKVLTNTTIICTFYMLNRKRITPSASNAHHSLSLPPPQAHFPHQPNSSPFSRFPCTLQHRRRCCHPWPD